MVSQSLSKLVRIYQRKHGPRLTEYLEYFQQRDSLSDVIHFSCHGKEGKVHSHQHLVGKVKLEEARKKLQEHASEITTCDSFENLLTLVEILTRPVYRFGVLAVYDTTLRLGASLGIWPEVVYLHAGTRRGCKALGVKVGGRTLAMDRLPIELQELEPYQAEDFLCLFKDHFNERK